MIISDRVHLVSTVSEEELHAYAQRAGISRSRYHGGRRGHPHYDLTEQNVQDIRTKWCECTWVSSKVLLALAWWGDANKLVGRMVIALEEDDASEEVYTIVAVDKEQNCLLTLQGETGERFEVSPDMVQL